TRLRRLWEERPDVPVVLLGPDHHPSIAHESLRLGVLDYIPRSCPAEALRRRLEEALARREPWVAERRRRGALEAIVACREQELHGTYRQVLEALGAALDTRHPETQDHTRRVMDQSVQVAQFMGVDGEELRELEWGAALHDVGKIGIPDAVLLKPGSL